MAKWPWAGQGPLKPAYALVGSCLQLQSEALAALQQRCLGKGSLTFNCERLEGKDLQPQALLAAARQLPFAAPYRLLVIEQACLLKAETQSALLSYLEQPNDKSVLCLQAAKLDKRSKLAKKLISAHMLLELSLPHGAALAPWLKERAAQQGHALSLPAAHCLLAWVGSEADVLLQALATLSLYVGEGGRIESEDVEAALGHLPNAGLSALSAAILAKDWALTSTLFAERLAQGDSVLLLWSVFVRQLRNVWVYKQLAGNSSQAATLAANAGIPPYLLSSLKNHHRRFDMQSLQAFWEQCTQLESNLKMAGPSAKLLLNAYMLAALRA